MHPSRLFSGALSLLGVSHRAFARHPVNPVTDIGSYWDPNEILPPGICKLELWHVPPNLPPDQNPYDEWQVLVSLKDHVQNDIGNSGKGVLKKNTILRVWNSNLPHEVLVRGPLRTDPISHFEFWYGDLHWNTTDAYRCQPPRDAEAWQQDMTVYLCKFECDMNGRYERYGSNTRGRNDTHPVPNAPRAATEPPAPTKTSPNALPPGIPTDAKLFSGVPFSRVPDIPTSLRPAPTHQPRTDEYVPGRCRIQLTEYTNLVVDHQPQFVNQATVQARLQSLTSSDRRWLATQHNVLRATEADHEYRIYGLGEEYLAYWPPASDYAPFEFVYAPKGLGVGFQYAWRSGNFDDTEEEIPGFIRRIQCEETGWGDAEGWSFEKLSHHHRTIYCDFDCLGE